MGFHKYTLLFLLFLTFNSFAQEVLSDLQTNPLLIKRWKENSSNESYKTEANTDTLELPFKDDFSKPDVYPDSSLWIDKNVFINRDYAIAPPTLGVATFDGLGKNGLPYDFNATISPEISDYLTSKPINLNNFTGNDSIYLSFFYQAQGRGNAPELDDSLVLEFKSASNEWTYVWSKTGYEIHANDCRQIAKDTSFRLIMIPIKDPLYLYKGFSFRFKNYATISGNVDHWHIDYVYLNKTRTLKDTIMDDVSFVYNASSLLNNYYSMPWNQFNSSELKKSLTNYIRNNDTSKANLFYKYYVKESSGLKIDSLVSGNFNIEPYSKSGYDNYAPRVNPAFHIDKFPILSDTSSIILEQILNTTPDLNRSNDTLRFQQKFYNYYAYDDGTAEYAYGLENAPFGKLAYKFTLNISDTLRAVQMFFNPFVNDIHDKGFLLTIWNDNHGTPGSVVFQDSVAYPKYELGYNSFHTYFMNEKIIVLSGTFYVGWVQLDYTDMLNIGFDLNNNSQDKIFFNTTGQWNNSCYKGSLMIRPFFGKKISFAGIENSLSVRKPLIEISPNPVMEELYINFKNSNELDNSCLINIFDSYGRLVYGETKYTGSSINVSSMPNGIYFIYIEDGRKNYYMRKLVITK